MQSAPRRDPLFLVAGLVASVVMTYSELGHRFKHWVAGVE